VYAHHDSLVASPDRFAQDLHRDLAKHVLGLKTLDKPQVDALLGADFSQKARPSAADRAPDTTGVLTDAGRQLWAALSSNRADSLFAAKPALEAAHPTPRAAAGLQNSFRPTSEEAYATIITGNDRAFVAGALVLAHSIRMHDGSRDLVAMMSVEADDADITRALELVGWKVGAWWTASS
jgi:hypothetical protein